MKKRKLKDILLFPLWLALGGMIFSLCCGFFVFGQDVLVLSVCFAFGMSIVELMLIYLFKEELKKLGIW